MRPVSKWDARGLRTGSGQKGPAHGSELFSSHALAGKRAEIWRVVVGKKCSCTLDLAI